MLIRTSALVAAWLSILNLPTITAFYPYEPVWSNDGTATSSSRRAPSPRDSSTDTVHKFPTITLNLRRVPLRRDNRFTIVSSSDPKQSNAVAIDQDGNDISYMAAMTLGSSKEEYHLLLDSAASNTWVMGSGCTTKACGSHDTFGSADSTSLKEDTSTDFAITYGTGQVAGHIGTDTLHIGSLAPSLTFGLATNVSDDFISYPMDGILGLGRGDNSDGNIDAPHLLDVLSSSSLIKSKLFGIHLTRGKDSTQDGELDLGEPNTSRYDGDLNYISVVNNDDGFWEISADDAGVDGKTLGLKGRSAILDSGTSYILMPPDDAAALHKLIPNSAQSGETFTVPCSSTQVVQLGFGGKTYNVSTADYVGGSVGSGNCKSNIVGRQTFGDNQWLVGDVFLKNVYTVFDFDNSRVGLGVPSSGSASSSNSVSSTVATSTSTSGSKATGSGSKSTSASSTANPTAESQQSSTASSTGIAGRTSASASSFALTVALGLLSVFL